MVRAVREEARALRPLRPPVEAEYRGRFSRYDFLVDVFRYVRQAAPGCRPQYVWGMLSGADLAKNLGMRKVSMFEFGVAGGAGLLEMEKIAAVLEERLGVEIELYGFDSGKGLIGIRDHRDLPNLWTESYFKMDVETLKSRLRKARLVLGDVNETVPHFQQTEFAPVAFVAYDLDLYTSTTAALGLLRADPRKMLPRVHCYFDDVMGYSYCEFNGELLAIREFNDREKTAKIAAVPGLAYFLGIHTEPWPGQIYLAHRFDHPDYGRNDGMLQQRELPIGR